MGVAADLPVREWLLNSFCCISSALYDVRQGVEPLDQRAQVRLAHPFQPPCQLLVTAAAQPIDQRSALFGGEHQRAAPIGGVGLPRSEAAPHELVHQQAGGGLGDAQRPGKSADGEAARSWPAA